MTMTGNDRFLNPHFLTPVPLPATPASNVQK